MIRISQQPIDLKNYRLIESGWIDIKYIRSAILMPDEIIPVKINFFKKIWNFLKLKLTKGRLK
jgi:hypothetical protein